MEIGFTRHLWSNCSTILDIASSLVFFKQDSGRYIAAKCLKLNLYGARQNILVPILRNFWTSMLASIFQSESAECVGSLNFLVPSSARKKTIESFGVVKLYMTVGGLAITLMANYKVSHQRKKSRWPNNQPGSWKDVALPSLAFDEVGHCLQEHYLRRK